MILSNEYERFHYMRGYFSGVIKNPENYIKEDLVFYFKELRKFLENSKQPLDDETLGRS